jgi:glycosyltransferase involved in cell wall biosynthesis
MGPLRVCMVHYSDFHIDSRIQRQARALAERGDEVDLVCLSPSGPVDDGAIRIHGVGTEKAAGGAGSYVGGYCRFLARAFWRVTRLDLARRYDVVEVHNMPDFLTLAAVAPKLRGARVILNVHDTFPELFATKFGAGDGDLRVRALLAEERASAALADAVITVTAEAADLLNSRGVGIGRTAVVMNTPDERLFGPAREPSEPPADGPVRALYHGGLAERFGVELLIRAAGRASRSVPRLALRICGTGDTQAELATLADAVAPGIVDVAPRPVPLEQIPSELELADIGIVPTLRDPFTELLLPVKLLEYVHMGIPAIAPRLPVIERYFGDTELRYFEPGSADALADAIVDVCADGAAARERAARASGRLAELAWPVQRDRYLGVIDGLAHGSTTPVATFVPQEAG